jgi:cell division protein FtsB
MLSLLAALSPLQKLVLAALAASLGVATCSIADPRGVQRLRRLESDIARQELANHELREENARLSRTVRELSPPVNPAALQRAAREQLGWVKQDEVLFQFQ